MHEFGLDESCFEYSWQPHIRFGEEHGELEGGRQNANDRHTLAVEGYGFAEQLRVCAKMTVPEAVADNNHVRATGLIFFRRERPAQNRCRAEDRK